MYRKNRMWRDLMIRFGKKPLILTLALVITISGAVSGSLAWLTAATETLTNTFTIGNINIDLKEDNVDDGSDTENSYEMEVGKDIDKNPTVTVYAGSKDCWLFVKIEESENFDDFLEYMIADGWKDDLGGGVYYRSVDESETDNQVFQVLKDDKVHVKDSVTKEMLDEISKENNYPYMKIKAFAVQRDADIVDIATAAGAWALIPDSEKNLSGTASAGSVVSADTGAASPNASAIAEIAPVQAVAAPQNYAQRQAQQAEAGWLAFVAPSGE